jgi:hypothetical protein
MLNLKVEQNVKYFRKVLLDILGSCLTPTRPCPVILLHLIATKVQVVVEGGEVQPLLAGGAE